MTGTSAAVPEGDLPSKSLASSSGELPGDALPGLSQRATSQRATSFVGTADYVAPEVIQCSGLAPGVELSGSLACCSCCNTRTSSVASKTGMRRCCSPRYM